MIFTAATSLLAIKRCATVQKQGLHERIDNKIEESRQILRHMRLSIDMSIASQALHSLEVLDSQISQEIKSRSLNPVAGIVLPSVEQNVDVALETFGELNDFDWLANPSALLSMQTLGSDMSWLAGSDLWLS